MFADLFTDVGRRNVPPMIVAVVMVLQRIEGCSDREAVDRFTFDARWKYAAGGLAFDYPGFVHTVLVDMRARLAASDRPDRIFEATLEAAKAAGLVGRKRVLDSTPLYDAVATMDTVTLIRSGIRGVLKAAGADLGAQLRAVIVRGLLRAPGWHGLDLRGAEPGVFWSVSAGLSVRCHSPKAFTSAGLATCERHQPPRPVRTGRLPGCRFSWRVAHHASAAVEVTQRNAGQDDELLEPRSDLHMGIPDRTWALRLSPCRRIPRSSAWEGASCRQGRGCA
jgi:hypothetical protein